ncbi:helix-turn-helix domain-containing protein [Cohnella rhizosphaerae]|uniref:Helix-turn-helix domain-containing protein n=1 Tax=Cohnella rhizosphaerae TaxID=1457232 RepID=A0A9X4KWB8_9BACL|nr:helix-turn-helix domain-containing protein [Cohnella rhizosphaerae]MDG0812355.1 helix-turn-helix domain-containing protein [Cohnella rhizosphaerae]
MKRNEEDVLLLQAMKDTQDKRMFQRYQAVFMYKSGYAVRDIQSVSQLSEKTIYTYIRSYEQSGLEGLAIGSSPGAPRKLTAEQETRLIQLVTSRRPDELELAGQARWTLKLVSALIEREFNQTYTPRGTSRLLQDLGLVYSDPRTAQALGDKKEKPPSPYDTHPHDLPRA